MCSESDDPDRARARATTSNGGGGVQHWGPRYHQNGNGRRPELRLLKNTPETAAWTDGAERGRVRRSWKCLNGVLLLSSLLLLMLAPLSVGAEPSNSDARIGLVTTPTRPIAGEETRLTVTLKDTNGQSIANASVSVTAEKVTSASTGGHAGMSGHEAMSTRITTVAKASEQIG